MRQRVRGYLDGYYVGREAREVPSGPKGASRYRIELYRATLDRIEPLADVEGEALEGTEERAGVGESTLDAIVPEGGLHQPRVPRVRLYSPMGQGRIFEGVLFDVRVPEPQYGGKARQGEAIYGRLSGWATAAVDLPEETVEPEPEPMEEVASAEVSENAEPVPDAARATSDEAGVTNEEAGARGEGASADGATQTPVEDDEERAAFELELPPAALESAERSTSLLLVGAIVLAFVLGATASGAYAAVWLTLALPTLLFRRLFHGILENIVGVRALALVLVLAQLACTASAWLAFRAGACHVIAPWALFVGLGSAFLSGLLPWRLPVVINGLAFVLMLWPAGQPASAECAAQRVERRSIHEPRTPRTNADGTWPRRPSGAE